MKLYNLGPLERRGLQKKPFPLIPLNQLNTREQIFYNLPTVKQSLDQWKRLHKKSLQFTNNLLEHMLQFVFPEVVIRLIVFFPSCLTYSRIIRGSHLGIWLCRVQGSLWPQISMSLASLQGASLLDHGLISTLNKTTRPCPTPLDYNLPKGHFNETIQKFQCFFLAS